MKTKFFLTLGVSLLPLSAAMAQSSVYCPQNAGYINPGMTEDQVISACGQPLSKGSPNAPITQKIPVQQLIYTNLNQGGIYPGQDAAFYTQWSLPSGTSGINLSIQVTNGKVSGVSINGASTNAASICQGISIQNGDPINKVYSACGTPSMVNNTFINQLIPPDSKPAVWIYQLNQYQSPISLTFVDGKLQSID